MTQDHKVNELKEGLSSLGEETKGLADKVPHLESVVSYLTSKVHEERMRYNETITNVEKTFSGLMNKIGALEGVINELHQHHELHEADHDNKEKEHAELHQKSKKELAEELMSKLRDHEEVEHGHGQNNGLVGLGRGTTEEEESSSSGSSGDDVSTVLLIVASPIRPDYLKKSLTYIANYHPK
jgi:chromosome segregation ATPase